MTLRDNNMSDTTSTTRDLSASRLNSPARGADNATAAITPETGAPDAAKSPSLNEVLEVVAEFGLASLGLVAWEMWSTDEALAPLWIQAIMDLLLEPAGLDDTGETMYRLSRAGHARLSLGKQT